MIECKVIADSITKDVPRLTTIVATYPRFIHSEVMTYRQWSRNASSSRAIPAAKLIEQAETNYVVPIKWGKNKAGMQSTEELGDFETKRAIAVWNSARLAAIDHAKLLTGLGVHKQLVNRILEPYTHITTIITGIDTSFANFFHQRVHPDAEDNMQALANAILEAYQGSTPRELKTGEWHLPFVRPEEYLATEALAIKASVARCARVSYLNHDGTEPNIGKDATLHDRLLLAGHFSPFEHQATPYFYNHPAMNGNLNGWLQNRKRLQNEYWTKPHERISP